MSTSVAASLIPVQRLQRTSATPACSSATSARSGTTSARSSATSASSSGTQGRLRHTSGLLHHRAQSRQLSGLFNVRPALSLPSSAGNVFHILASSPVEAPNSTPVTTSPPKKIKGKTVVITGGSQGCGRATALMFAKKGYNVVVAAREPTRLADVALEVGQVAVPARAQAGWGMPTDITNSDDVAALAAAVEERYEQVDILINNAGVCLTGSLKDTSMEDMSNQINVNFMGAVAMTKAFQSMIESSKGSIVFVNSFGGVMPLKNMTAYTASKYALAGFGDALRYEMKDKQVHVAQVHPGVINSNFMERAEFRGKEATEARDRMTEMLKGGGIVQQPEEIAQAVVDAVEGKKDEIIVGAAFNALVKGYRLFGTNPFAMGPSMQ